MLGGNIRAMHATGNVCQDNTSQGDVTQGKGVKSVGGWTIESKT